MSIKDLPSSRAKLTGGPVQRNRPPTLSMCYGAKFAATASAKPSGFGPKLDGESRTKNRAVAENSRGTRGLFVCVLNRLQYHTGYYDLDS